MANIRFYISKIKTAGKSEVLVRFYAGKINQQAHTGVFVPCDRWDADGGRCTVSKRYECPTNAAARKAQTSLDELAEQIFAAYTKDKGRGVRSGWLKDVIQQYHGANEPTDPPVSDLVEAYCAARMVAPATKRKMLSLRTHLRNFEEHTGRTLRVSTLSVQDLRDFSAFLLHGIDRGQPRAQNSVSGRIRQLRTVIYWAGKPHPNPFEEYEIPAEAYGTPIYLTAEERELLYRCDTLTESKAVQRDIFVFQCHTGCRVGDLLALTERNVNADGWLVYVPAKTAKENPETVEVPLTSVALEIVERYKGKAGGKLFPFVSADKYNKAIRQICKTANLDRSVIVTDPITRRSKAVPLWSVCTSHTARKTFTQAIYSTTGDKRLTASLTGHSENSKAFNRYTEVSRQMKSAAVRAASAISCENTQPKTESPDKNDTQQPPATA